MIEYFLRFEWLKGYRTLAAAIVAIASGVVQLIDGDGHGVESIALGLGLLGLRFREQS